LILFDVDGLEAHKVLGYWWEITMDKILSVNTDHFISTVKRRLGAREEELPSDRWRAYFRAVVQWMHKIEQRDLWSTTRTCIRVERFLT
jgi:hypothetical protein